jgi:glycosyltransferase involved in cell wall biosynthesis
LSQDRSNLDGKLARWERSVAIYRGPVQIAKRWLLRRRLGAPLNGFLPSRLMFIRRQRSDLQITFDIRTLKGREDLLGWYLFNGYREMGLKASADGPCFAAIVNRPMRGLRHLDFVPVTWLMWAMRLRQQLPIKPRRTAEGQRQLLAWYFTVGLTDYQLESFLTEEQASALLASDGGSNGIPRLLELIWQSMPDAKSRFTSPFDPAFRFWCHAEGGRHFPILAHPLINLARRQSLPAVALSQHHGVNLIGHALGRSGLGEDLRMAARSLASAGIAFSIFNLHPGDGMPEEDEALRNRISDDLPFSINMFCTTGMSTIYAALRNRRLITDGRRNIGIWPWELPEWPEFWSHAYDFVDEIWATSHFTYAAYCRSSPVPVRHMPMAVAVDDSDGMGREDFDLPAAPFLFLHAFDGLSSYARKNPMACILAFQRAFRHDNDSVGLVLKGLRAESDSRWAAIEAAAAKDHRIHLRTNSYSRGSLLDLYRCTDAFLSLHRSEGFGRNIAEMMLLGKPAIVSAHSGNLDFTTHHNAALVPVALRRVKDGEYPFGAGQRWAEPDVDAAARMMQQVAGDADWRSLIASRGQETIAHRYSPEQVGKLWRAAIQTPSLARARIYSI